jgi:hypothetical protein
MHRILLIAALCALAAAQVSAADVPACQNAMVYIGAGPVETITRISPQDAKAWIDYTVPLPKQIEIRAAAAVPKGSVGFELKAADKHVVYGQIREEFLDTCGFNSPDEPIFWLTIDVGGTKAEALKKLANANQAYSIVPSHVDKSITITALTYRGAYYGWKTLQQLIKAKSTSDKLTIPMLVVTDWPDMEKRGIWGVDNFDHLLWFADRKMNHMEQINAKGVNGQGNFYIHTRENSVVLETEGPKYAIDYAPVILHLEQGWHEETMGKFHPEVKSKGGSPGVLCYSEPKTTEMISEWIYQAASYSPTTEVDLWLSENMSGKKGCQCEQCGKNPYAVNEARVCVKAWEMAKQRLGRDIILYLLTSEATEADNQQIFAELPKDIRIWYYHSLFTYNTIRQPMLRPYLSDVVKTGRWMGVCPNLDAWTHVNVPFTNAPLIHYRMTEFVTKGLQGLLGYPTPRVHLHKFNVEAAAEWTWNLKGRGTTEFARSYAVRQGYKDPAKFAQWCEMIGPVSWDIFGSGWPAGQLKNQGVKVKTALKDGTLPPLGFIHGESWPTPWGNIKSEKQLAADVAAAKKAVRLAQEMGIPQYIHESLVMEGYIRNLNALYGLKKLAPKGVSFAPSDQYKAKALLKELVDGKDQAVANLPKWESCVEDPQDENRGFTNRPIEILTQVTNDLLTTAAEMGSGVKLPAPPEEERQGRGGRRKR